MRGSRRLASVFVGLFAAVVTFGCGHDSPGPGGAAISGNVSTALTASFEQGRGSWLAWLREDVLGLAKSAHAQGADVSLDGITVIARGGGRELSDLTDPQGDFLINDAPTAEISIILRRGGCEASFPLGGVISGSTITLSNVSFDCTSTNGTASPGSIVERFSGVVRNEPGGPNDDMKVCTRVGNDDRTRHLIPDGATFEDRNGQPTSFGAIEKRDLLDIRGNRSSTGSSFNFQTLNMQILQRNTQDQCNDDPFV